MPSHRQTPSLSQNQKALLANAYNELGKELASSKIKVVGNYTLGKVIGEGAYGKVRLGTHRLTGTRVAIKQIPKAMSAALTREIHHHRQLHHPHITQMYEVIATESSIWIVTELCCGGELFDYLVEKGRLAEDEARAIFGQLCLAVAYLHDHGIVHRDLKLENVLLDEHCRVKLGDFGFTREYDRGSFMETFCGTTGYAAPEMLQGKKYQGPEVDIWSLGVILYCLLTGGLPFDDDDELVMRDKIIQGEFEDPVWLSNESRDLIKHILQMDFTKRISISNILNHPWFTAPNLTYDYDSPTDAVPPTLSPRAATPEDRRNSESTGADSSPPSSSQDCLLQPDSVSSTPTTPADDSLNEDPLESRLNHICATSSPPSSPPSRPSPSTSSIPRQQSSSTIRRSADLESLSSKLSISKTGNGNDKPSTVIEETLPPDQHLDQQTPFPRRHTPSPLPIALASAGISKGPPLRTPARTKRRSVSSILSDSGSPTADKTPVPLPPPLARDLNFSNLLNAPAPIIFSTPGERRLLNMLSSLGFNTTQIVHSVLSNACDSAGAIWWMLRRKEGERELITGTDGAATAVEDEGESTVLVASPTDLDGPLDKSRDPDSRRPQDSAISSSAPRLSPTKKKKAKVSIGVQTIPSEVYTYPYVDNVQVVNVPASVVAPRFSFIPPTPTFARPSTPPRNVSPTKSPMLSPSSSNTTSNGEVGSNRSHPSTPGGSLREKDKEGKDKDKDKGRKPRSGSVSIMQRATTALEAAGLVRKKSTEAVREEKERERERQMERERERERERSREMERRAASGDEPRSSHGSGGSSKLTKSPPLKPSKDNAPAPPSTPPPTEANVYHSHHLHKTSMGSPWVLADVGSGSAPQLATASAGNPGPTSGVSVASPSGPGVSMVSVKGELLHSQSTPNFPSSTTGESGENTPTGPSHSKKESTTSPRAGNSLNTATIRGATKPPGQTANRNRANLLQAFRWLFNEERKGKRKDSGDSVKAAAAAAAANTNSAPGAYSRRPVSRRGSSAGKFAPSASGTVATSSAAAPRVSQRPSMSSRRSSSVNSRRSSGTSVQMMMMESPHANPSAGGGGRRSFGSHTPNSERGAGGEAFDSSRPSSIRSFSMQAPATSSGAAARTGHKKSPSQSSSGSLNKYHHHSHSHHQFRTASPNVQKFHRRAGSGSSSTRVMRRGQPHARSNSCASSIHSPPSSRPTSFYEPSESEGGSGITPSSYTYQRTSSPFRSRTTSSSKRTSGDDGKPAAATFIQKRQGPFTSPAYTGSISRSSWKKSWGLEPPGWKSRTAQLPIEVIAISPAGGSNSDPVSIRDVFSGKGGSTTAGASGAIVSTGGGDDSDWVDEDDDIPPFAGGLGQSGLLTGYTATGASASTTTAATGVVESLKPGVVTLSPAPRGHRTISSTSTSSGQTGTKRSGPRSKPGLSPAGRVSPLPLPDFGYEAGRRQMPNARTGPAFKQAIQEEDEEEEEDDF